ncbi:MAG: terminase small subunit [Rhodospirillales bacterium]|nr:terminase small subunit [Rhodospirillales bacterium]
MSRLKPRHERFCRLFVECTNATLAAKAAGYTPRSARNAGYRLLRHPRIAERICEIQRELAQTHCRNVDVLLGKLETVYRRAIDDHHFAAAARAVELQAKLAGVAPVAPASRVRRLPSDTNEATKRDSALLETSAPAPQEPPEQAASRAPRSDDGHDSSE